MNTTQLERIINEQIAQGADKMKLTDLLWLYVGGYDNFHHELMILFNQGKIAIRRTCKNVPDRDELYKKIIVFRIVSQEQCCKIPYTISTPDTKNNIRIIRQNTQNILKPNKL